MIYRNTQSQALLAFGIVNALAAVACSADSATPKESNESAAPAVAVQPVSTRTIKDRLVLHGVLEPAEDTQIAAAQAGIVDEVRVEEGDRVAAGRILATIAAGPAKARLQQAEAALDAARSAFDRTKALAAEDLASSSALDNARTSLSRAEAEYEMAQTQWENAVVRAPHAGRIAAKNISVGEYANPGTPLFRLIDLSRVEVVGQIPERDVTLFTVGDDAEVHVDAWPERTFPGRIKYVGIAANRNSRTFDLKVRIDNPDGILRAGMMSRLSLVRRTYEDALVVRRDAVVEGFGDSSVFVVDGGTAHRKAIRLGPVEDTYAVVLEGVSRGDDVVVSGQRFLGDGQPVRITRRSNGGIPVAGVPSQEASQADAEAEKN